MVDYQATGLQDQQIPPFIAITVYRVVQEALGNILKHANARNVSIILDSRPDYILVIIEDDGCGFEVERVWKEHGQRHLGLLGMKERTKLAKGSFHIESEIGSGTTVYVRIPIVGEEDGTSDGKIAHFPG